MKTRGYRYSCCRAGESVNLAAYRSASSSFCMGHQQNYDPKKVPTAAMEPLLPGISVRPSESADLRKG
jgi:hypothetical protein